ncbi:hypothetical protein BH10ACI1_BH10ACI1_31400 [soil metagenome]
MNSEELELSLRNEFESNLKDTLADIQQEIVLLQEKVEAEFVKHKAQLNEVFQEFSDRVSAEKKLNAGFTETVIEHLRLARDEGSKVAVAAMEKAEAMQAEAEPVVPKVNLSELRDAINDISSKNTQSLILKTLVQHAAQYTPRGAFFIIKNEHLVGWRVFGKEGSADEQAVREVFFPVAAETVLGESVRSLSAVESSYGTYSDDLIYLNKLDFGHPDRMFAVPLVVRGRSVAVLYADNGNDGEDVNIEALETLARVAGLTVEVLASARVAKSSAETSEKFYEEESGSLDSNYTNFESQKETVESDSEAEKESFSDETETVESPVEEVSEVAETESSSFEMVESSEKSEEFESSEVSEETEKPQAEFAEVEEEVSEPQEEVQTETEVTEVTEETEEVEEVQDEKSDYYEPVAETPVSMEDYLTPTTGNFESVPDYHFESSQSFEPAISEFEEIAPQVEKSSFESTPFEYSPSQAVEEPSIPQNDFNNFEVESFKAETSPVSSELVETVSEPVVKTTPVRSRFSDRNVDLPIEVGEEERRLHNDARRFARLLVSEIKLYNEQKVKEGRDASDLYERLREAIDRSREMYDKRVQPPVAARFDYFHYEVVSTLAEGDENKLGGSYPGATV